MGSLAGHVKPPDESWRVGVAAAAPSALAPVAATPSRANQQALGREAYSPTAAAMPAQAIRRGTTAVPVGPSELAEPQGAWPASPPINALGSSAPTPARPAPVATAAATSGRRCQGCSAPMPAGFVFCGQCGSRWVEVQAAGRTMFLSGGAELEARPLGRLVALRPDGAPGEVITLHDDETSLGREAAVAFPTDRLLSPHHATLYFRDGRLFIRDEGSLNGVFLRLYDERELRSGEIFRIGQQLLRYDDKRDIELILPPTPGDDTYVLGSPDLGYWGRLAQILTRSRVGNVYLLSGAEVTLGRERAHITFPFDGFVSSAHAAILRRGDKVWLADRGSSNGTYVRVSGETQLDNGALLLVGQNLLRVELA